MQLTSHDWFRRESMYFVQLFRLNLTENLKINTCLNKAILLFGFVDKCSLG
jgi:hypothetical protein